MKNLFDISISASDDNYLALRNNEKFLYLRMYCERLWRNFSPFADPSFPFEFARQLHPRFFEMYLGNQLLEMGFHLLPRRSVNSPDLHFIHDKKHIWIEATTSDEGIGNDAVPDIFVHSRFDPIPEEKIILRFTNSISAKKKQLEEYLKKEIVKPNDAYIIAINGGMIRMTIFDGPIPAIVKSVYPVGDLVVIMDPKKGIISEQYKQRSEIVKENEAKSSVSTRGFLDPIYSMISGVLYSNATLWNLPNQSDSVFLYIHNYLAENPMEKGWITIDKEWWWEGNNLVLHKIKEAPKNNYT